MKKVLVVDDHILFREGLVSLFQNHPKYKIVGEAGTVSKTIELARLLKPDLILMDMGLPDGSGIEAAQIILAESPECKLVFLTITDDDETLFDALRCGASGYILKNAAVGELLKHLDGLDSGEIAISPAMATRIIKEFARTEPQASQKPSDVPKLSRREIEILREMARGLPNQEIAKNLFISENTVKHHIHSILTKLDLPDRQEASRYAREHKLIN